MPNPGGSTVPADVLERARKVRLACFDVDGTLTDGRLTFDSDGRELKSFHAQDGQGLVLLRDAGVAIALITARESKVAKRRAAELKLRVFTGAKDKLAVLRGLCAELGIPLDAVLFMGDDLADREAMRAAGLAIAPANAHRWTADIAHWRTQARGGKGAAREACDLVLEAQGLAADLLQRGPRA